MLHVVWEDFNQSHYALRDHENKKLCVAWHRVQVVAWIAEAGTHSPATVEWCRHCLLHQCLYIGLGLGTLSLFSVAAVTMCLTSLPGPSHKLVETRLLCALYL